MARIYIHSRKYRQRNTKLIKLIIVCSVLGLAVAGAAIYHQYNRVNQTPKTIVENSKLTLTGYINPYFLFKDTGRWLQDKADSTANKIIYNQYKGGVVEQKLIVYVNKTPTSVDLAASRVLPVQVVNGDSLSAQNLSKPCSALLPSGQRSVKQITIDGTTMLCDPSGTTYTVSLAQQGGDYQIKMSKSKNNVTFVIIYTDYSANPNPETIINIANSFRAI